jgi:prepilin-type N-terminal cleavage/methylation domain-containing protein
MKIKGFTLIEVMIVVAILGILSAIAIPAYSGYMRNTRMIKAMDHVDTAVRWVTEGFVNERIRRDRGAPFVAANEMGLAAGNQTEFPRSAATLVNALNSDPGGAGNPLAISPEMGLPAYATAPNVNAGQVGIAISALTGTDGGWGRGDTVTITPPAGSVQQMTCSCCNVSPRGLLTYQSVNALVGQANSTPPTASSSGVIFPYPAPGHNRRTPC